MSTGSPPSSRPYLATNPSLVKARGTLRDAMGALGNLDQLLRSLRVGPKAISAVLPDVLDSCGPAQLAVHELLEATGRGLGNTAAVAHLEQFLQPRFQELGASIGEAIKTSMQARHRLELERTVTRLWPELEAGRALVDLLEESISAPSIRLKLRELLTEISVADVGGDADPVQAVLRGEVDGVELLVQPQVAMMLLSLGVNFVAMQSGQTPELAVETRAEEGLTIRFQPQAGPGEPLLVTRQTIVSPTYACLEAAATRIGCSVVRDADGSSFSVTWR